MAVFSRWCGLQGSLLFSSHFLRNKNMTKITSTSFVNSGLQQDDQGETAAGPHSIPASIFHDELVSKFVNCMMYDGKKAVSQRILLKTFECIKKKQLALKLKSKTADEVITDPLVVFHKAMENAQPVVGVQPIKKAGKTYQVPTPLTSNRRRFLAVNWLIGTARDKRGPRNARMSEKLCHELLNAYHNEGTVVQKKQDLHKLAESNRAFANFRWW